MQYEVSILYCENQLHYLMVNVSLSVFNWLPLAFPLLNEIKETLFFQSCYTFTFLCFVRKHPSGPGKIRICSKSPSEITSSMC